MVTYDDVDLATSSDWSGVFGEVRTAVKPRLHQATRRQYNPCFSR